VTRLRVTVEPKVGTVPTFPLTTVCTGLPRNPAVEEKKSNIFVHDRGDFC